MKKRIMLGVAALALMTAAQAEDKYGARLTFPIVVEKASIPGGVATESGGIAFQQSFRSEKAVRLTAPLSIPYLPPDSKDALAIKLVSGTVFVLARDKTGELYCAANSSDVGFLVSMLTGPLVTPFKDYGVCIRDTNADGSLDSAIVVDQKPVRTRTAYEIIGLGKSEWKTAAIASEAVQASQIPLADIRITYDYYSGGLIGKRHGLLHFMVCWPAALVSPDASDEKNKGCANLPLDGRGEGVDIGAGVGARTQFMSDPFIIEAVTDKDDKLTLTMKQSVIAGPGVLTVAGRLWRPDKPLFQRTIVNFHQDGVPKVEVPIPPELRDIMGK